MIFIDGSHLLCRSMFSNEDPSMDHWMYYTYTFLRSMDVLIRKFNDSNIVVAFDKGKSIRRSSIYPEYKFRGELSDSDEDLLLKNKLEQYGIARKYILEKGESLGFKSVCIPGVEADDLASAVRKLIDDSSNLIYVTEDKDWIQLISNPRICVYRPINDKLLDYKKLKERFPNSSDPGLSFVIEKSLIGDSSDSIPGIPKIGGVTSGRFINNELVNRDANGMLSLVENYDRFLTNYILVDLENQPDEVIEKLKDQLNSQNPTQRQSIIESNRSTLEVDIELGKHKKSNNLEIVDELKELIAEL